jgi:hypothetical protein
VCDIPWRVSGTCCAIASELAVKRDTQLYLPPVAINHIATATATATATAISSGGGGGGWWAELGSHRPHTPQGSA